MSSIGFSDNPEVWRKYYEHIPQEENLSLIVLKGHLLIEEELNQILSNFFNHPQFLPHMKFGNTSKLVKSIYYKERDDWLWECVRKLNDVRNKYAHSLEPSDIEKDLKEITLLVKNDLSPEEPLSVKKIHDSIGIILGLINLIRTKNA